MNGSQRISSRDRSTPPGSLYFDEYQEANTLTAATHRVRADPIQILTNLSPGKYKSKRSAINPMMAHCILEPENGSPERASSWALWNKAQGTKVMVGSLDLFEEVWISSLPSTPQTGRISDIWPDEWRKLPQILLANFETPQASELDKITFDLLDDTDPIDSDTTPSLNHDALADSVQSSTNHARDNIEPEIPATEETPISSDTSPIPVSPRSSAQVVNETPGNDHCTEEGNNHGSEQSCSEHAVEVDISLAEENSFSSDPPPCSSTQVINEMASDIYTEEKIIGDSRGTGQSLPQVIIGLERSVTEKISLSSDATSRPLSTPPPQSSAQIIGVTVVNDPCTDEGDTGDDRGTDQVCSLYAIEPKVLSIASDAPPPPNLPSSSSAQMINESLVGSSCAKEEFRNDTGDSEQARPPDAIETDTPAGNETSLSSDAPPPTSPSSSSAQIISESHVRNSCAMEEVTMDSSGSEQTALNLPILPPNLQANKPDADESSQQQSSVKTSALQGEQTTASGSTIAPGSSSSDLAAPSYQVKDTTTCPPILPPLAIPDTASGFEVYFNLLDTSSRADSRTGNITISTSSLTSAPEQRVTDTKTSPTRTLFPSAPPESRTERSISCITHAQASRLRSRNQELEEKCDRLRKRNDELERKNRELEKKHEDLEKDLAERAAMGADWLGSSFD